MEFEFGKNGTVKDLNIVPEQFRGMYAAGTDGYVLSEGFVGVGAAVDGLNKSLKASRRDADEFKKGKVDLTPFAEIGQLVGLEGDEAVNPVALRTAVETVIKSSKDGAVNWEKMKGDLNKGFQAQLTAKDGEIQGMNKTLVKHLITSQAVTAIAANKGAAELLLPIISGQTKVIKEGEDYVVRVVDAAGDPRGNAAGGFMSVEDLVKEMKASPVYGRAFESEGQSGSGFKPNGGQQKAQVKTGDLSANDRIAKGLAARQR
jgi:hypothetical protein